MTLGAYLDTVYVLRLEEITLARQGVDVSDGRTQLDEILDDYLPGELSPEAAELERRRRIALENQEAIRKMTGLSSPGVRNR